MRKRQGQMFEGPVVEDAAGDRVELRDRGGFTLVELLVVIFIIALLAGLITAGVGKAKQTTKKAQATTEINAFGVGLTTYYQDYNLYPGYQIEADPDKNAFPDLFEALLGQKPPDGRGGKGSPYVEYKRENVCVLDPAAAEEDEDGDGSPYVEADPSDLNDPDVPKYLLDPFGNPYIYRENKSKRPKESYMINPAKYDLWSVGINGKNESADGYEKGVDDIGNW